MDAEGSLLHFKIGNYIFTDFGKRIHKNYHQDNTNIFTFITMKSSFEHMFFPLFTDLTCLAFEN